MAPSALHPTPSLPHMSGREEIVPDADGSTTSPTWPRTQLGGSPEAMNLVRLLLAAYHRNVNRPVPRYCSRHRLAEWTLLSVAVLSALAFVAVLAYVGYGFMLSWAGLPLRYVLLVTIPLAVSVVASLSLARLARSRICWAVERRDERPLRRGVGL